MSEKPALPKWLIDTQQKSWEPEILLSGIVLFGLLQLPDALNEFIVYFKNNFISSLTDVNNLVVILKACIRLITIGLILHLISRGIWIGMVGLSYVFPRGIRHETLNFTPPFEQKIKKIPNIETVIIRLEKLCSMIFSLSFLFFMTIFGTYIYFFTLVIFPVYILLLFTGIELNETTGGIITIYGNFISLIGLITLIDYLFLGFLKRLKWISRLYYPIYIFVYFLTLSRYYRIIYYTLITNYNKQLVILILFLFISISVLYVLNDINKTNPGDTLGMSEIWASPMGSATFPGYYDDQDENYVSIHAQIQSDIITNGTIRLFIVHRPDDEEHLMVYCRDDSLASRSAQEILSCINRFYHITIDDSVYKNQQYFFHFEQDSRQKGFITYIDISDKESGTYSVSVDGPKDVFNNPRAIIPFFKQ